MPDKYAASVSDDGTITIRPTQAAKVKIVLMGRDDNFPSCYDEMCPLTRACANHHTVGDFRLEGGITPSLRLVDGVWECRQNPNNPNDGAIMADGTLLKSGE